MNRNRIVLTLAFVLLAQSSMASAPPSSGFVRPSSMVKKSAEGVIAPTAESNLSVSALADMNRRHATSMVEALDKKQPLDPALKMRLIEAVAKNKTIMDAVREILNDTSQRTTEINKLRLELLSDLGAINVHDHATLEEAKSNQELASRLSIARLALGLKMNQLTDEAITNAKVFLAELKINLQAGVEPKEALKGAATETAMVTGHEVHVELIDEVAARPQEGVIALFKGSQDRGSFIVNGPEGKPLEINMTAAEGEAMEKDAWDMALNLYELAKDPASMSDNMAARALERLEKKSDEAQVFLQNNPILNKKSPMKEQLDAESKVTIDSVDELLASLKRYDELVSGKGKDYYAEKAKSMLKGIPLLGRAVSSFEEAVTTERSKIEKLEELIVKSGQQLQENNKTLMDLKGRSLKIRRQLEIEIARVKVVSDYVLHLAAQAEEQGDKHLATTLRSEIMQSLERKKNSAMTFHLVLGVSDQAISQIVSQNNQLIEQASALRDTAIPIISINQTIKVAGEQAQVVAHQQTQIRRFTTDQLVQIQNNLQANAKILNEMAQLPLIEPKVIQDFEATMKKIGEERTVAMQTAAETLRGVNDTLIQMMNDRAHGADRQDIGLMTHTMVHGDAKACATAVSNKH